MRQYVQDRTSHSLFKRSVSSQIIHPARTGQPLRGSFAISRKLEAINLPMEAKAPTAKLSDTQTQTGLVMLMDESRYPDMSILWVAERLPGVRRSSQLWRSLLPRLNISPKRIQDEKPYG